MKLPYLVAALIVLSTTHNPPICRRTLLNAMPPSKQILFIPYKHAAIVLALLFFLIMHWLYTPKTLDAHQTINTVVNLSLPLSTKKINQIDIDPVVIHQEQVSIIEPILKAEAISGTETIIIEPILDKKEDKIVVRSGDILSLLFDQYDLGQTALRHILSADESLLALETLHPGQILYFRYDKNTQSLKEMELYKHAGHRIIYRRIADNAFDYNTIIREGEWHNKRIGGKIENTFYLSAQRAGLTEIEAATVTHIFQEQLNFSRSIRKGDQFQIIRSVQTIDSKPTGETRIKSARVQRRAYEHTAFLFDDGRYYDKKGKSLARAFTRTPLGKSYRISSRFNPRRVHPVTGRVARHNGTDFAAPTGTKVLSTGDGVVSRTGNHLFAGRYIDIQHGGQYKTRYLHLHKVLVRRGESISRGQTIALSGNSGRSTGPHLHFELHIHGQPVDPMKAKIPISRSVPQQHKEIFDKKVGEQTFLLNTATQLTKIVINDSE
jgi:murein DD-endopeptidase